MTEQQNAAVGDQIPQPSGKIDPPTSFTLYVESAKWLIAIMSGLMAFGFEQVKDSSVQIIQLYFYLSCTAFFLVGILSALIYVFYSYAYLSERESGKSKEEANSWWIVGNIAFKIMLFCFAIGAFSFAGFGFADVAQLLHDKSTSEITSSSCCTVLERGEERWILHQDRTGQTIWKPLPDPK